MRVGVDLDGVVYDFATPFRYWCEARYGVDLPHPDCWDFYTDQWQLGTGRDFVADMARACADGAVWWRGDPMPGSRDAMGSLVADGHEVVIVSHRRSPLDRLDDQRFRWATEAWVSAAQLPHHDLILTARKTLLGLDVLVDDGPGNVAAAVDAGERVIVFDQPWNAHVDHPYRAAGWSTVVEMIRSWERDGLPDTVFGR